MAEQNTAVDKTLFDSRLKEGPKLIKVAATLGISRQTLYRQIELYRDGEEEKMNRFVLRYFDSVCRGEYADRESAQADLENIRFEMDADRDNEISMLRDEYDELIRERYTVMKGDGDAEEKKRKNSEIIERIRELERRAAGKGLDLRDHRAMGDPLAWSDGPIRTACTYDGNSATVILDCDYDRCRGIYVEFLIEIDGEDYPVYRAHPAENAKFVQVPIPDGRLYKYRLWWTENGKVMTTDPCPVQSPCSIRPRHFRY